MSSQYISYSSRNGGSGSGGITTYATFSAFPATATDGAAAIALDTDTLYIFTTSTNTWLPVASPGSVLSVGTIDTQTASANGAVIASNNLVMQSASATRPGLVNTTTQTLAGNKTFSGTIAASNLSGTNTGDVTLTAVGSSPSANAASLSGQALTLQPADATHPGVIIVGSQTISGGKTIQGVSDAVQLTIQGFATQTNNIIEVITSGFGSLVTLSNAGALHVAGNFDSGGSITGLKYFGSTAATATTGVYNLANAEAVAWRNTLNNGDKTITLDGSNIFQFDSAINSTGNITGANLSGTNTGNVTLAAVGSSPSANGASLSGQVLTLQPADATHPGVLTASDWNTFNNKQAALTPGTISTSTTGVTIGSGTSSTVGPNVTVNVQTASGSQPGLLSSTDWSTFNSKQATITVGALDAQAATATGLALVSNVISTQSADATHPGVLNTTTQTIAGAKTFSGGITATVTGTASGNTTVTPNNHGVVLSGAANALTVIAPDASTVKTLISGGASADPAWGILAIGGGGTGQVTKAAAFDALSPMSASGDIIYGGASGTGTRLAKGSDTQVLTLASGVPTWASPAASGSYAVTTKTTTYGASSSDNVILLDDSGGSWTLTLPTAVGITGHVFILKKITNNLTNFVTVNTTSAQTIDGSASGVVKVCTFNESFELVSDGSNWQISDHKSNTPWTTYTPTLTNLGTTSNLSFQWKRAGNSVHIRGVFTCGTVGASLPQFGTPGALTILSGFSTTNGEGYVCGSAIWNGSGVNGTATMVSIAGSAFFRIGLQNATQNSGNAGVNGSVFSSSVTVALYAEAPLTNWYES